MTRKFFVVTLMAALLGALAWSLPAAANISISNVPVTGYLTADNNFALYYGNADGTVMSDRIMEGHDSGTLYTINTSVPFGDYLYVVVWNTQGPKYDTTNPQAWLGQISFGNKTVNSDLSQWQYIYNTATGNPQNGGYLDPISLGTAIGQGGNNGQWLYGTPTLIQAPPIFPNTVFSVLPNGNTSPYGPGNIWWQYGNQNFASVDPTIGQADWIWFDWFVGSASQMQDSDHPNGQDGYAVFRVQVVPLPASALLLGSGLLGLGLLGIRRQKR